MKWRKRRWQKVIRGTGAVILTGLGITCVTVRLIQAQLSPPLDIIAAEMTLPVGTASYRESSHTVSKNSNQPSSLSENQPSSDQPAPSVTSSDDSSDEPLPSKPVISEKPRTKGSKEFQSSQPTDEELSAYQTEHDGEEQYPVYEFTATQGNISYQNIQVKNTASIDIDIQQELESELGFRIESTDEPQVLIYHTHTTESYLPYDTGFFYESFFPRTTDEHQNVCAVGEEIAKQLNLAGITAIHDTTLHDYPSYSGAYDRSLETIQEYLAQYPSIKVVLDIHRDGIGTDTEKSKPVFTADGHQGAQIMILSGYNADDCEEFRDWEYNLRFALRIQDTASRMYPEMVRPLNFSDFMYNMNVNTGSLLIEVGAESNTVEEARYSGYLLGNVLSSVLQPSD